MAKNKDPLPNPLDETTSHSTRLQETAAKSLVIPQAGEGTNEKSNTQFLVAYHAGPEWIGFCGKHWQRDVAQSVTAEEWAAMQARGDFNEFNFTEEQ